MHVGGTTRIEAGTGDVTLAHAGNDFTGTVDVAGGAVSLRDANTLTLSRLASAADRDVQIAAGGALTLPAQAIDTGTGALQLVARGGSLTTRGALAGGDIVLHGASGITLGHDVDAGGTLALESRGALTQTAGRIAAGVLTGAVDGSATLEGGNRIDRLGAFSADGIRLANAQSLAIDAAVDAGGSLRLAIDGDLAIDARVAADDLRLESTGGITRGTVGQLVARTLSGRAGGAVVLGDAGTFVDNRIERVGDFTARSGFSLTNGRALTLASLNGSAFTVDAGTADVYLSVVGDLRQDGTDRLYNGSGTWAATGGIGQPAAPIHVTGLDAQTVARVGQPPAYFHALRPDGSLLPIVGEGAVNIPTLEWADRAQAASLHQVSYVDVGADAPAASAYDVVGAGIRLPADQTPTCDPDVTGEECVAVAR